MEPGEAGRGKKTPEEGDAQLGKAIFHLDRAADSFAPDVVHTINVGGVEI